MASEGIPTSLLHPRRLTIAQILGSVAALAVAFAVLPWVLSIALAIAVCGVLALEGLPVPLITSGGRLWRWFPWIIWWVALAASPVMIVLIGYLFEWNGPPATFGPRPWAACLVVSLFYTHLAVSVVTSWAVIFLVRGPGRWVAWGAIILVGIITGFVALGAAMATTGVYL